MPWPRTSIDRFPGKLGEALIVAIQGKASELEETTISPPDLSSGNDAKSAGDGILPTPSSVRHSPWWRTWPVWVALIGVVALLVAALSRFDAGTPEKDSQIATQTAPVVVLVATPLASSSPVRSTATVLPGKTVISGTISTAVDSAVLMATPTSSSTQTETPTLASTATPTPTETSVPAAIVSSQTVNLRTGPGTDYINGRPICQRH